MKNAITQWFSLKLALLAILLLPNLGKAQFTENQVGDVDIGFRKTGTAAESHEMVVYLGNFVTNILNVPNGTTVNITNFVYQDLTNMCPDNFNNLQWSVFGANYISSQSYSNTSFPIGTCLYTIARTNTSQVTIAKTRISKTNSGLLASQMVGVENGAYNISQNDYVATNVYNNPLVVVEPVSDTLNYLTAYIGDRTTPSYGDFSGNKGIAFTVENVTSNAFTSPAISDFFLSVPTTEVDPITGLTTGNVDYLGYFTLNPSGSMTFTRASAAVAPTAGFTASPTNGFAPLQVSFSDTSTGTITTWAWVYGDGTGVTNSSNTTVSHTYTTAGTYTATLTVSGSGGSNSAGKTVVVSSTPTVSSVSLVNSTNLIFSGTNCPIGVQYRFLMATNVNIPLASWKPVYTNTFTGAGTFSYTNVTTNAANFFRMVSP